MSKKYLSDVINFDSDIAPYRRILIYAGVGAGKNTWVSKLAESGANILLITSRANTADAQTDKLNASRRIKIEELYKRHFRLDSNYQKIYVVTNAGIESYLKHIYKEDDPKTHIWKYFDYIILDEAHSLIADATFADSPFHVRNFMEWAYSHSDRCKIIYMTGTPKNISALLKEISKADDYNYLDYYSQCNHVDPYVVSLKEYSEVVADMKTSYERGEKMIYFSNSIKRIQNLADGLTKEHGICEKDIFISYSNMSTDQRKFSKGLITRSLENEDYLKANDKLKDDVKIFITTSKNQEGININNTDIPFVITESQDMTSLIQMSGRVRSGIDELVILFNAPLHSNRFSVVEKDICITCLNPINELLHSEKYQEDEAAQQELIKYVEEKFSLIRYNYLSKAFSSYDGRIIGSKQEQDDSFKLQKLGEDWLGETEYWGNTPHNILTDCFPYSSIYRNQRPLIESAALIKIRKFIEKQNTGEIMDKEKRDKFIANLKEYILSDDDVRYIYGNVNEQRQPNAIVKQFGYTFVEQSNHGSYFLQKAKKVAPTN